jgi:O-methyltransferase involved in polyketide biosynthesis
MVSFFRLAFYGRYHGPQYCFCCKQKIPVFPKEGENVNGVNKTLYIPLYGKSYVSKKGLFLNDKKAEEIWEAEGFALKGKAKSKWLAYYMGVRAAVFDAWVKRETANAQETVVIHVGCGMDSRVLRVKEQAAAWFDMDFAEVIEERKRYFTEGSGYTMLAGDAVRQAGCLPCRMERMPVWSWRASACI